MYGEEADLCLRSIVAGYQPIVTPNCTIVHYQGASIKINNVRQEMIAKAKSTLIRDHWMTPLQPLGLMLLWQWGATRRFGAMMHEKILRKGRSEQSDTWKAIWQNRADWLRGYK
jgi:GT2 family glycosyltransferase